MNDNLSEVLEEILLDRGAAAVGFADLSQLDSSRRPGFIRGISIVCALSPSVVKELPEGPTRAYYEEYERVNDRLEKLVKVAENFLAEEGYKSGSDSVTTYTEKGTYRTRLPHKTVATRAGLGWIGKNALLITEEYGGAVRIATVLTGAPLKTGEPVNISSCGDCSECVEACFADAIKGVRWNVNKDRDELIAPTLCREKGRKKAARVGLDGVFCGRCFAVCPYTQKYITQNQK